MRSFATCLLAVGLAVFLGGQVLAQVGRTAPRGVEPIPGYTGLYVADADSFMAGAFLQIMLSNPKDVRAFLARRKTCASERAMVSRLRSAGVNAAGVASREILTALRTGACDIFIGTDFNFAQLDRRLDGNTPPGNDTLPPPDDDVRPPDDDVRPPDDVVIDRTPPRIAPVRDVFSNQGRRVTVEARITDEQSAIREAYVLMAGDRRVRMTASSGSSLYSATVDLPRDFNDQPAFVVATNTADRSARAAVTLRLLPWCGPPEAVSGTLVRQVQDGLTCVGFSPGGSDGALGPNTCRSIAGYLGNRMAQFNEGRLSWVALRDELGRACQAAQPVALDVPRFIEADVARTRLPVGLLQPGATEAIRLTGPGIGSQVRAWRGQPVVFDVPMPPPGQEVTLSVEALGPQGRALDQASLRLIRPPVVLNVRPAGEIMVDGSAADFTVSILSGAAAVARIEALSTIGGPVVQPFEGRSVILSVPAPEPGGSQRVTFAAVDQRGTALARQTVTMTRPAPVAPPRLTLASPDGRIVDAASARLQVLLENPGSAQELVLRSMPEMTVLASRPVGNGTWELSQPLPPPGQELLMLAQALDRAGRVLADAELRLRRAAVELDVRPAERIEADTDSVVARATVRSGADWVTTIVARAPDGRGGGEILTESRLAGGQAQLQLAMPEPGESLPIEIVAMDRNGAAHAPQTITLVRPPAAVLGPVTLRVTSLDGFSVDADITRLSVEVANPADTAVIVLSDAGSGEVLARAPYAGIDWRVPVKMPEPGADRSLLVEAQNSRGETLATSQITLLRAAAVGLLVPPWVWGAVLALAGVGFGYLIARFRTGGGAPEPGDDLIRPVARPRIFAEADDDPSFSFQPSSPPTLVISVEEDTAPRIEIELNQNMGAEP